MEQSYNRLRKDLGVDTNRNWKLFTTKEKGFQEAEIDRVKSELAKWRRGSSRARTVMIVTMKQHDHLKNQATLFSGVDLSNVPTLIIDDEGDQAGMNTKALQEQESTTYARITALRESLYRAVFIKNLLSYLAEKILLLNTTNFRGDYPRRTEDGPYSFGAPRTPTTCSQQKHKRTYHS